MEDSLGVNRQRMIENAVIECENEIYLKDITRSDVVGDDKDFE